MWRRFINAVKLHALDPGVGIILWVTSLGQLVELAVELKHIWLFSVENDFGEVFLNVFLAYLPLFLLFNHFLQSRFLFAPAMNTLAQAIAKIQMLATELLLKFDFGL